MNRIKELRDECGWTQEELGKKINVNKAAISKYEKEQVSISDDMVRQLTSIFKCTSDYLLGISDIRTQQDERITQAIGADEELLDFWKVLKEREDLKLMLKQTKDLPDSDIKTIFRIIKSFEDENQK